MSNTKEEQKKYSFYLNNKPVEFDSFPNGETYPKIVGNKDLLYLFETNSPMEITWARFNGPKDIMELALLKNVIDLNKGSEHLVNLIIPSLPYARMDRSEEITVKSEFFESIGAMANLFEMPISLKVLADIINSLGFHNIYIDAPHNEGAVQLLFKPKNQLIIRGLSDLIYPDRDDVLIAPDAGAYKAVSKLARKMKIETGIISCHKYRDFKTGEIKSMSINIPEEYLDKNLTVVDDLIDGGRTFIEIAEYIRNTYKDRFTGKLKLAVAHGYFTSAENKEKLYSLYDNIFVYHDYS